MRLITEMITDIVTERAKSWKAYVSTNKGVKFYITTRASSRLEAKAKLEDRLTEGCRVIYLWQNF